MQLNRDQRGMMCCVRSAGTVIFHEPSVWASWRSTSQLLGCQVLQNVFFILSTEVCPHSHMANHSSGKRWRQLLRRAMATAAVRVELSTAIRLLRAFSCRRRFGRGSDRLKRCPGLSENQRCACDRCYERQLHQDVSLHFKPPFQMAGKRNRYVTVVSQIFTLPVLENCRP